MADIANSELSPAEFHKLSPMERIEYKVDVSLKRLNHLEQQIKTAVGFINGAKWAFGIAVATFLLFMNKLGLGHLVRAE